jgi:hypothetical protein
MAGPLSSARSPQSAEPSPHESARMTARELERFMPPEPHERFHIDPRFFPAGMQVQWLPYLIKGMLNPQVNDYWRAGWVPARAEEFPEMSGYKLPIPAALKSVRLPDGTSLGQEVQADDPVIKDGQMLIVRPKEISEYAEERRDRGAKRQFRDHIDRITSQSRAAIGDKTRFRQFAARDEASTDQK